jgi:hypothetical protein
MLSLEYVLKGDFIQGQPDSSSFGEVSFGVSIGKHLVCQNHSQACPALMCHYLQSVILELDLTVQRGGQGMRHDCLIYLTEHVSPLILFFI